MWYFYGLGSVEERKLNRASHLINLNSPNFTKSINSGNQISGSHWQGWRKKRDGSAEGKSLIPETGSAGHSWKECRGSHCMEKLHTVRMLCPLHFWNFGAPLILSCWELPVHWWYLEISLPSIHQISMSSPTPSSDNYSYVQTSAKCSLGAKELLKTTVIVV